MAIYLLAIYHIAEWLRTTLLLMITCVGANITIVHYITMLNCIFGFVAYIFCYVTYFSESGQACAKAQDFRGKFLLAEVILFWILFMPYLYPIGFLLCCKKQSHEQILNKVEESEEED
jgi:predicted membrane protein